MFTSIIKESLGTKVAECNIYNYIAEHYWWWKAAIITSHKEYGSISGNVNLKHTRYTHLIISY